ncbi:MAG: collagen-like protein, partial [Prevotellaceae bacterium]|nr:collagen-like protein [Prevotellaceae bacterium]
MKHLFKTACCFLLLLLASGCQKKLWNEIDEIKRQEQALAARVAALEAWQITVNNNISGLQNIVAALQDNDYVTRVETFSNPSPGGHYIHFTKSPQATIWHGTPGAAGEPGQDGEDGEDGQPGATPHIAVADSAGVYYWTLNGVFIEI